MKKLFAVSLLILSSLVSAQELHTFSNGEVADAEKINENFEALKSEISGSGGCSAEQDGSSVVITCADGTSGILASAGVTVLLLEAQNGQLNLEEYPTGAVVVQDANEVLLGEAIRINGGFGSAVINIDLSGSSNQLALFNDDIGGSVKVTSGTSLEAYFLTEDCTGVAFIRSDRYVVKLGEKYYVPDDVRETLLFKSNYSVENYDSSSFRSASDCRQRLDTYAARRLDEVILPEEIRLAAYPLSIVQLP